MTKNKDKWKKFAAVSIVAALSVGLSYLMRLLTISMSEDVIERKNLRPILDEIEKSNVDIHTLSNVLRETPPVLPFFISALIGIAITVWAYHRILRFICKNRDRQQ